MLDRALEQMGPADVRALLAPSAGAEAELSDRTRLLVLTREHDVARAAELVVDAAANAPEEQLRQPLFRRAVQAALVDLVERDARHRDALVRRIPDAPGAVQATILDALGDDISAWDLSRLLGRTLELNRIVLRRLLRCPVAAREPLDPGCWHHVEWSLDDHDPTGRRVAVLVIGRFHRADLAPHLLDVLEDEDAGVASAAHRALSQMTGMQFLPRRDLWARWLAGETRWLDDTADDAVEQAHGADTAVAVTALRRIARHRLHREDLVPRLEEVCLHDAPEVRAAACETLGALGSPNGLEFLLQRTEDKDPRVVSAADAALTTITGLPSPDEPGAWSEKIALWRPW
jgi:hypothetical protein